MDLNKIYMIVRHRRIPAGVLLLCFLIAPGTVVGNGVPGAASFNPGRVARIDSIAAGILRAELTNGITARIFSPAYLSERIETFPAGPVLTLDDGERLDLIGGIDDPRISNTGDGTFHPFDPDDVIRALGEIDCAGMALELDLYLLPLPRCELPSSSTRGGDIFLSPHVRELSYEGSAFIVTHEAGHAFQNRYLPLNAVTRWNEYRGLRGIEDEIVFNASAGHAYRPVEIFAEDFRVLFGGAAARYDGSIENPELSAPGLVAGLGEYIEALTGLPPVDGAIARVENYPNPFNPATEVWVELTDACIQSRERLSVRIYDVTGSFVRELFSGIAGERSLRLQWDGRDAMGEAVASAAYFCMVRAGEETETRKLLLIK